MIVDDADALMLWLSAVLEPLCDADPAALSKYVIALIKKDKPETELRNSMVQQMEVFLQDSTSHFIDSLFKTLSNKDYLDGPPKVIAPRKCDDNDDGKYEEGKPDSTTSTPANVSELASDLREAEHRSSRKSAEDERSRRRSPKDRRNSSPRRRRSSGHRGRHRSRSRSPYRRAGGRRNSPFNRRSRSRSYSPRRGSRSPPRRYASRGSTPTRDEDSTAYTPSAVPVTGKRPRCRDYDEKGFCLKGDQCKFDHGNDAVVLEDTSNPPPYMPGGYAEPYVPAPAAPVLPPLHLPPPGYPPAQTGGGPRKRSYEDSGNAGSGGYPPAKRFDYNRLGGRGRGRGGGGHGGRPGGSSKVLVKNIPSGLNTIAHINNHFARFGTLVNVQIHFEGDPGSALVSFSHPNEASAAMNSSEAVFGNRFIKMFYSYHDRGSVKDRLGDSSNLKGDKVTMEGSTITKTIVNTDLVTSKEDPESTSPTTEEGIAAKESRKAAAIAAIKKNQEVLELKAKMKKEADEKKTEVIKKTDELLKSKQDFLDKLIDQQKKLILKMEAKKGVLKPEEKTDIMTSLKSLSTLIEKTKEELKMSLAQQSGQNVRKSFVDVQKELLDAELELFNAQQEDAENVDEIQKRVNRLRVEAAQKGFLPTSRGALRGGRGSPMMRGSRGRILRGGMFARGRGIRGGGFRGRGRGAYMHPGQTSLDRRPTSLLVLDVEDKETVLAHLAKFGEIVETTEDEEAKTLTVQYKTRREAEAVMQKGKQMGELALNLTWHTVSLGDSIEQEHEETEDSLLADQSDLLDDYTPLDPTYLPPGLEEEDQKAASGDEEDTKAEEEEEEDEEEEDDAERSWKR